jgi:hypothetical protein
MHIQKKSEVPVNAVGFRIDAPDSMTLEVWHEEGIDQFLMKKACDGASLSR